MRNSKKSADKMRPLGLLTILLQASVLALFCMVPQIGAQEETSDSFPQDASEIDSLFEAEEKGESEEQSDNEADKEETEESEESGESAVAELSILERAQERDAVEMKADISLITGYSPGWMQPLGSGGAYEDLPVVKFGSKIDLLYTVSPILSFSQKFSFSYPGYDLKLTELSMDYSLGEAGYLALGLKTVKWGRSPNFPFTNIIHRQADKPLSPANSQNTLIGNLQIPIGIGGVELLVQNKEEYQEDPAALRADRLGVGAKYNLAVERLDLDIGAYYQRGLSGRLFVSGTTTLTDWLEFYSEGLIADERLRMDSTEVEDEVIEEGKTQLAPGYVISDNNPDYAASIGMVLGLFDYALDLNAEYFYNGEETELQVATGQFPLFWGHNVAVNVDYQMPNAPVRLRTALRYNKKFNSTFFAPRLTVDLIRHITFDVIGGFFWGPEEAGYRAENPDEADRPSFLAFTVTINGKI